MAPVVLLDTVVPSGAQESVAVKVIVGVGWGTVLEVVLHVHPATAVLVGLGDAAVVVVIGLGDAAVVVVGLGDAAVVAVGLGGAAVVVTGLADAAVVGLGEVPAAHALSTLQVVAAERDSLFTHTDCVS